MALNMFLAAVRQLCISFWGNVFSNLLPIFKFDGFSYYEYREFCVYSGHNPSSDMRFAKHILSACDLSVCFLNRVICKANVFNFDEVQFIKTVF